MPESFNPELHELLADAAHLAFAQCPRGESKARWLQRQAAEVERCMWQHWFAMLQAEDKAKAKAAVST